MKIILANLMLALLFISPTLAATATTAATVSVEALPESLPTTKADLLGYALSNGRYGYTSIWSQKILASVGEKRYINVTGTDADDVVKKLTDPAEEFRFKVYDPDADIYAYSSVSDTYGYQLFQSEFKVIATEKLDGKLVLKSTSLNLKLAWEIPFHLPNATQARIEYTDAYGKSWTKYLNVFNGVVLFPVQYASGNGTLIITCYYPNDGTTVDTAYSTATGEKIPGIETTGTIVSAIENHVSGNDASLTTGSPLLLNLLATAPSTNQWNIVTPPSASIKLSSTQVGGKRFCVFTFQVNCSKQQLGTIEAWAYDPARVDSDGTVEQIGGNVSINETVVQGLPTTTVSVTWNLDNDGTTPDGSKWTLLIEASGYEKQGTPQPPYYDGGKG